MGVRLDHPLRGRVALPLLVALIAFPFAMHAID